jgi:hypothetical protein
MNWVLVYNQPINHLTIGIDRSGGGLITRRQKFAVIFYARHVISDKTIPQLSF